MKGKLILLIVGIFILILPLAFSESSATEFTIAANGMWKLNNITFEGTTCTIGDVGCEQNFSSSSTSSKDGIGNLLRTTGEKWFYVHSLLNISEDLNWSLTFASEIVSLGDTWNDWSVKGRNVTGGDSATIHLLRDESGVLGMSGGDGAGGGLFHSECAYGVEGDGISHNWKFDFLDNGSVSAFIDGVFMCNALIQDVATNGDRSVSYFWNDGSEGQHTLDNLTFFNCTAGAGVAVDDCSYPIGLFEPPAGSEQINNTIPNMTISYPSNGDIIDNSTKFPILINGTVTIQNGSLANITINNTNFINFGNVTLFNFTFNGSNVEGRYVINLTVNSTAGNQSSQILTFTVDVTNPLIDRSTLDTNHPL